ncbi:MAG TPA: peptidoglycan DD-metalloendopeptidase family protein [Burkholderiales bacterium]
MVQERGTPARAPEAPYREVVAGDTLYSIAWESGRDYRDLAEWNGLEPPYLIRPGQRLRLYPPGSARAKAASPPPPDHRVVARGDTLYAIAQDVGVSYRDLAAWNGLEPPYVIHPGQRLRVAPPEAARGSAGGAPRAVRKVRVDDMPATGAIAWQWPTEGRVIARFAPGNGAKGIDIAGTAGQDVRAAAAGKVVYQGSGLRGYGQLIIIKHNADYLSAYAHCGAIYVQEGSVIRAGQKIAAMGSSGTDRVKLHFEIRRRGVPVDPLDFLPKK